MLNFNKPLYIVDCTYFKTPQLYSHGEVQEIIKRHPKNIKSIHKADITTGVQVDFKHFVPKRYQTEYEPTQYRIQNLWMKIWNDKEI